MVVQRNAQIFSQQYQGTKLSDHWTTDEYACETELRTNVRA